MDDGCVFGFGQAWRFWTGFAVFLMGLLGVRSVFEWDIGQRMIFFTR
jgi:hypothetical protein